MSECNGGHFERALRAAMSGCTRWIGLALCIVYTLALPRHAYGAEYEADAVKAAFLHRFAAYVEWPKEQINRSQPFTIAVLDDTRIVDHLQRLLPGLTIRDQRPQVRSVSSVNDLSDVHILYVGESHARRLEAVSQALRDRPILVVTDQADGLAKGGVINFVQVGRNVRFEVALPEARRRRLQISSGLLSVAVRVEESPPRR